MNRSSSTGSRYTPDELVQPLLKHSLDYPQMLLIFEHDVRV
jgi:hypothetical protein